MLGLAFKPSVERSKSPMRHRTKLCRTMLVSTHVSPLKLLGEDMEDEPERMYSLSCSHRGNSWKVIVNASLTLFSTFFAVSVRPFEAGGFLFREDMTMLRWKRN
jgi:hypothetical protein